MPFPDSILVEPGSELARGVGNGEEWWASRVLSVESEGECVGGKGVSLAIWRSRVGGRGQGEVKRRILRRKRDSSDSSRGFPRNKDIVQ